VSRKLIFGVVIAALLVLAPGVQAVVVRRAVAYRPAYHPVARTAAVTTAAVATAVVVGSVVNTLPPACSSTVVGNVAYQQCGSTWYQPRYAGTQVNYVVVNPPQ
jgi:hypothetical protein